MRTLAIMSLAILFMITGCQGMQGNLLQMTESINGTGYVLSQIDGPGWNSTTEIASRINPDGTLTMVEITVYESMDNRTIDHVFKLNGGR
jgi:hypothetical protein